MDFKKFYSIYKKLPLIFAIISFIPVIVWAITDWSEWITVIGELDFGGFMIWLIIGVPFSAAVYFFTALVMSPTVVITDAVLRIEKSLKKKNSNPCEKTLNNKSPGSFSERDIGVLPEL